MDIQAGGHRFFASDVDLKGIHLQGEKRRSEENVPKPEVKRKAPRKENSFFFFLILEIGSHKDVYGRDQAYHTPQSTFS